MRSLSCAVPYISHRLLNRSEHRSASDVFVTVLVSVKEADPDVWSPPYVTLKPWTDQLGTEHVSLEYLACQCEGLRVLVLDGTARASKTTERALSTAILL